MRAIAGLILWASLVGCESSRRMPEAAGVRDSSGVAIVTLSSASLDSVPEWRLGSARILVATDASKQVLVFDASGEVVWLHERIGSGPGEYRHLQLLASSDMTSFTLHDGSARRLTVVPLDSSALSLVSLQASPAGPFNPVYRFPSGGLLVRTANPAQGYQQTALSETAIA